MGLIALPKGVETILVSLHTHGEKAYVVGGCVRDILMGNKPHDWDICTSATPEQVKNILHRYPIIDTGLKHGTVTVVMEDGNYEVTTFRIDTSYSDGRHPDHVRFVRRIDEDLSRRDFTMNAIAYNNEDGIVDPYGGEDDIEAHLIYCVGAPDYRFGEDALRILRAVRFSAQLGFRIEFSTAEAMRRQKDRLGSISAERIGVEFKKTVCGRYASNAIRDSQDIFCKIIPELAPMIGCEQNNKYHHEDVFAHTLTALGNAEACRQIPREWADDYVRLALFFHDFGKPVSKTTGEDGFDHFYGHAQVSGKIAEEVMRRLRFSNAEIETVVQLIAHHDVEFSPTKPCVRRLLNKFGVDQLRRLLKLRECDNRAHAEAAHQRFDSQTLPFVSLLCEVLAEQPAFSLKNLAVNGNDVLAYPIKQGPVVGKILNHLLCLVMDGKVENTREQLLAELDKTVLRIWMGGEV